MNKPVRVVVISALVLVALNVLVIVSTVIWYSLHPVGEDFVNHYPFEDVESYDEVLNEIRTLADEAVPNGSQQMQNVVIYQMSSDFGASYAMVKKSETETVRIAWDFRAKEWRTKAVEASSRPTFALDALEYSLDQAKDDAIDVADETAPEGYDASVDKVEVAIPLQPAVYEDGPHPDSPVIQVTVASEELKITPSFFNVEYRADGLPAPKAPDFGDPEAVIVEIESLVRGAGITGEMNVRALDSARFLPFGREYFTQNRPGKYDFHGSTSETGISVTHEIGQFPRFATENIRRTPEEDFVPMSTVDIAGLKSKIPLAPSPGAFYIEVVDGELTSDAGEGKPRRR